MATHRITTFGVGLLVLVLPLAQLASAATIGFEPSEGYVPGSLVGQQGWVANSYYTGPNGTVEVSTVSPLAGSQSLRYTQINSGLFADVSKANVVSVPSLGTTAAIGVRVQLLTDCLGNLSSDAPPPCL